MPFWLKYGINFLLGILSCDLRNLSLHKCFALLLLVVQLDVTLLILAFTCA